MTLAETVAEIKRQGGLVYIPHPFDRMHAVPDYEHLLDIVEDIDTIEVYNPRARSAPSTRRPSASPPSTASSPGPARTRTSRPGLGSVRIRMPDFDGPEEFLEACATPRSRRSLGPCSTCRR